MKQFEVTIEEEERQMILLALAELALSRPGWNDALKGIVKKLHGVEMFEDFKRINSDRVKATHGAVV